MITLRPVRTSDINAIVSLSNRRLWQQHTGVDEWPTDPVKKTKMLPWERLTMYQKYLNGGVWCDPSMYKNHFNWLTRNGGFVLGAEETEGVMKRLVAFCEIWCAEEPSPIGKTGSVTIIQADTTFTEDPIPKLYAFAKKEVRSRGFSTLAICPFSSRALAANLDDSRWELLALNRKYRISRSELSPSELPHSVTDIPHSDLPMGDLLSLDQSFVPSYLWASLWEEFEQIPEMRGSMQRSQVRKVTIEKSGQSINAVLWIWTLGDLEDYWRLGIWVSPEKRDDQELMYDLVRIAAQVWDEEIPGFELCVDEENGSFLVNRQFKLDEEIPAEPRFYTAV
ncbi:hypothetical protein CEE37_10045 [candidate division LCP-89 bacterium B3_LCP]|uniref:Uncharacterized protein n=1 Tax=candidate division LCP-89 bacterium B3_LCP TaxID=2012998 RepID=A0A532UYW4_UNCL8|nr:MAG: hypothetical protein CEE37_10045 [candidate division LCP-89 bacterium B3_LCP]